MSEGGTRTATKSPRTEISSPSVIFFELGVWHSIFSIKLFSFRSMD